MTGQLPQISHEIWDMKYRLKEFDGTPIDQTMDDTWLRVAKALAAAEDGVINQTHWEKQFYGIMVSREFSPAGRIISGAGTGRAVTLANCYTMGTIPDSMDGIFSHLKEAALTMQQGGGIGYDFSTIRPMGSEVKGVAADASGPLSFMDVWDSMCRTIMSAGCLHGDTLIHTDKGHLPIRDIVEGQLPLRVLTHKGWQEITDYFDKGEAEMVRVELETGSSITCTPDHRFHTIVKGEVIKKRIGDMKVGDKALFVAKPPLHQSDATVSDDLSYLLGHVWANGYTDWRKGEIHAVTIIFSDCPIGQQTRARCEAICEAAGYAFASRAGDGACTVIHLHKASAQALCDLAGAKPKSADIMFPEGVSIIPFIAGYFDGDGSWTSPKKGPHIDSVSKPMLLEVQRHLFDLGIPSKLSKQTREKWQDLWMLSIPNQGWQHRFLSVFGHLISKVQEPTKQQGHGFTYPIGVMDGIEFKSSHIKGRISMSNKNVGYKVIEDLFPEADVLSFGGVKILSIEKAGRGHVYDLEVAETHSYVAENISVSNSRRGAMMATMRCDHPDIEAFIEAKRDPARLRMFNLSVLVTDAFMAAVKEDAPWRLHFENRHGETISEKTIKARDLWNRIMGNTYAFAEPGVIFIDRVNSDHNIGYLETIATTNPCAEKPMGPYASCLLGSINLAMLVRNAFTDASRIDMARLEEVVETAIRAMDNVIEVSNYPLEAQMLKAKNDRQLGLGVTGLADALIMCGLTYGSEAAVAWTDRVMGLIAEAAYNTSLGLAIEKGSFQTFDADEFLKAPRFAGRMLPVSLKSEIAKHGIRNALLLSIAPTGTISLYAGNVSSGIEPVFALSYVRKVLQDDGSKREETVEDYAVAAYRKFWNDNSDGFSYWSNDLLPDYFVTAQTLSPEAHLAMTGVVQKWVDSSISKTINLPENISFEDFKSVYLTAYELGCKGCTTYRPNAITGSVLSVTEAPKKETIPPSVEVIPRPDALEGQTYKIKWPANEHAMYVTINDIVENGERRPFEVFINSKNMEHFAWTVALTRMISAVFRRPHDSRFVAEELKAVFDPKGGAWVGGKYVPSVLAAIGGVIERHMIAIGYMADIRPAMVDDGAHVVEVVNAPGGMVADPRKGDEICPKCFSGNVKHEAGCFQCIDCGHSKCG